MALILVTGFAAVMLLIVFVIIFNVFKFFKGGSIIFLMSTLFPLIWLMTLMYKDLSDPMEYIVATVFVPAVYYIVLGYPIAITFLYLQSHENQEYQKRLRLEEEKARGN